MEKEGKEENTEAEESSSESTESPKEEIIVAKKENIDAGTHKLVAEEKSSSLTTGEENKQDPDSISRRKLPDWTKRNLLKISNISKSNLSLDRSFSEPPEGPAELSDQGINYESDLNKA